MGEARLLLTVSGIFKVMSEAVVMLVFTISHIKNLSSWWMKIGYFETILVD